VAHSNAGCYAKGMTISGGCSGIALAGQLLACAALAACGGVTSERAGSDVSGPSGGAGEAAMDTRGTFAAPNPSSTPAAPAAAAAQSPCPSEVNALLDKVGSIVVPARIQCGLTNGAFSAQVQELFDCFLAAPADLGAEFTVNNCTDCSIPTTYVSTPTPEYLAILLENDQYGDAFREARVSRCSAVELSAMGVGCRDREELYACTELRH
jgi:hypothetical protein